MPGGRGLSNLYRPKTKNGRSGFTDINPEQPFGVYEEKTRNGATQNPERDDTKPGTAVPPLPNIYLSSSLAYGTGGASGNANWQSIKSGLASRLSPDIASAWFDNVNIATISEREIVLEAPNKFHRMYLENNFARAVLDVCQACKPTIECDLS